ncbi:MAG: amylo-alpha-1,6-glucosidase [Planctomycetota bacterium]
MDKPWTTHRLTVDAAEGERTATPGDMLGREWLLTNGTGGYSMGTALGCNTRRYHGLLVAATNPPVGRVVALNQVFDQMILSAGDGSEQPDQSIELGSCLFRNDEGQLVHAPHGDQVISGFQRGLTVAWSYRWGKLSVERELVLHDGEQAATLRYHVSGLKQLGGRATLRVAPMLTLRDFHSLLHREVAPEGFAVKTTGRGKKVTVSQGNTSVTLASADGTFTEVPDWWLGLTYPRETYRGQDDREDYFVPGHFDLPLSTDGKTATVAITVALGKKAAEPMEKMPTKDYTGAAKKMPGTDLQRKIFAIATTDFLVERKVNNRKLSTVIAGYPWFADWGRDTFIALPGLLLTPGRYRYPRARDVLWVFARAIKDGLVPNRFDDYTNEPHYNTVDGSLWYVAAGLAYIEASGTSPKWLTRAMTQIVDAYAAGTHAQGHDGRPIPIAMDDDGLIAAGDDHSQLTWMDAACGDAVFTPRPGKCVEINALWYHALIGLSQLLEGGTAKDVAAAGDYTKLAKRVKRSFVSTFWSNDWNRLIDHVTPAGHVDPSLRPNMVFACSLPNSPLPAAKRKAVLAAIKDHLLTPMGLRTLPADDPNYHPHYAGPQFDRDKSYHQGTVWPWPLGAYAEGVLRAGKFSKKAKAEATAALQPLVDRLLDAGLGQLHEIFDADAGFTGIHEPRGCPAQAWSIAEVVRVLALIEAD